MEKQKSKSYNYITRLLSSFRKLWVAQDILKLSNIRIGNLKYMLTFPLAMALINIQESLNPIELHIFGLSADDVTIIAFALGVSIGKIVSKETNISILAKIFAFFTFAGCISWILVSDEFYKFVCSVIFLLGVGGCMSTGSFSFIFIINNSERFFGCVFMSFLLGLATINYGYILTYPPVKIAVVLALTIGITICSFWTKNADCLYAVRKSAKKFDPSIWLSLFLVLSYFSVNVFGSYVPEFQVRSSPQLINIFFIIPTLLCVAMITSVRQSLWTMCNLFFLSSIMSCMFGFAKIPDAAYILFGLKEIGFIVSFYLFTCAINKFCSVSMEKIFSAICVLFIAVIYVVPDMFIKGEISFPFAVIVPSALFVVFLLLSPLFSKYLFVADWSGDLCSLTMSEAKERVDRSDKFENLDLTPREKEIAAHLLHGLAVKQIAATLGIKFDTAKYHAKNLYKKLGINSKPELFVRFGAEEKITGKETVSIK